MARSSTSAFGLKNPRDHPKERLKLCLVDSDSHHRDHRPRTTIMRIGILTAGGDCPGLNAAIRAVVRCASADGAEVLGIRNGYLGLFENDVEVLTRERVSGILPRGG